MKESNQPLMCQFIKWHTACCFRVPMHYNKYISKRGGMYHRKRKSSTLGELYFFFKNKQKNKGINTFGTFYRHLTGDPGGSDLVSYDTKQTLSRKPP